MEVERGTICRTEMQRDEIGWRAGRLQFGRRPLTFVPPGARSLQRCVADTWVGR
jgi:hypothetical protein